MISSHIARAARTVVPTDTLQFSRILVQHVVVAKSSLLMLRLSSLNTADYTEITKTCKICGDSRHDSKIRDGCTNFVKVAIAAKNLQP